MKHRAVYSIVLCFSLFISVTAIIIDGVCYYRSDKGKARLAFNKKFDRICLEMPMKDVVEIMGKSPDYEFAYQSFYIAYYSPPPARMRKTAILSGYKPGLSVHKLADLPNLYDYIQLAFNSNRVLIAYTRIGESYTVRMSNQEPVKGSHFSAIERAGRNFK